MESTGALLNATWLARVVYGLVVLSPVSAAAQPVATPVRWTVQSGTLRFLGHGTVGDFVGTTSSVSGVAVGDLPEARGWIEAPVATLVTGNDWRDRDLRAAMEVGKYPTMRFDLDSARVSHGEEDNSVAAVLHGRLAIHGVVRDVVVPAVTTQNGDTLRLAAAFPLDLTDYRIGGLTKLAGLLHMKRNIDVRVDLRFLRATHEVTIPIFRPDRRFFR